MDRVPDLEETQMAGQDGPEALLERMYLEAYLQSKGYCFHDLCSLPEGEAKRLMIEACRYASARLAEVEARAQFQQEIHGVTQPG